jgi:hypothetical protein
MKPFTMESNINFNDVLDNLALYYVIRKEYTEVVERVVEEMEEEALDSQNVEENPESKPS